MADSTREPGRLAHPKAPKTSVIEWPRVKAVTTFTIRREAAFHPA